MPPKNGYKSHRGRSAIARRSEFGGASGTNGIMPSVYVMTTTGEKIRTNYFPAFGIPQVMPYSILVTFLINGVSDLSIIATSSFYFVLLVFQMVFYHQ